MTVRQGQGGGCGGEITTRRPVVTSPAYHRDRGSAGRTIVSSTVPVIGSNSAPPQTLTCCIRCLHFYQRSCEESYSEIEPFSVYKLVFLVVQTYQITGIVNRTMYDLVVNIIHVSVRF